jgi:hypothetical protein
MTAVSMGSAEGIAVASLVGYSFYKAYLNPSANGKEILLGAQIVIMALVLSMGSLSIVRNAVGLSVVWVYLSLGIMLGSGANAFGAICDKCDQEDAANSFARGHYTIGKEGVVLVLDRRGLVNSVSRVRLKK